MSDSDYSTIGWQERDDAYADMFRVWKGSPATLRNFSEKVASLVEALQADPVWEKVGALQRTLTVTDRYDELPAPLDREDLAACVDATEKCRSELAAEIDKLRLMESELREVAKHAKWNAEKPVRLE